MADHEIRPNSLQLLEYRVEVLNLAALDGLVLRRDLWLCVAQNAVEPAQHGHRQDDLAVVAAQQVSDRPQEVGDLVEAVELARLGAAASGMACLSSRVEECTFTAAAHIGVVQ